ncbi:hypothetical protein MMC34_004201 [Xylographa carneopallida]|nr:hypothetical protein [Xylographa carneopallida]
MAAYSQKDIDAIFARGTRKSVSVKAVHQAPPYASPIAIFNAIQPSLTRPCSTTHLERHLQRLQNGKSSQTATGVESQIQDTATDQHTGGMFHGTSSAQQRTTIAHVPKNAENNFWEITSSDTSSSNVGEHRHSVPAGDLSLLSDATLNITLAQQMLYRCDLTNDYTTEGSTSVTQESVMLDSPESMLSLEGSQSVDQLTSIMGKQSSSLHNSNRRVIRDSSQQRKHLHQRHTPIKPQNSATTGHTTCVNDSTGTQDLSRPTGKLEAPVKAKIRTSQEQALQDEEDARVEREMFDMDHEYEKQTESRRQYLMKMEHHAELKRSMASAADARRVIESRAAANFVRKGKPGRNTAGDSALPLVICPEVDDIGTWSIAKDTLPILMPYRSTANPGVTAASCSTTHNGIRGSPPYCIGLQSPNGDISEKKKSERQILDHQSEYNRKLRIAVRQVGKRMIDTERNRNEQNQKLTLNPLQDCPSSSMEPGATRTIGCDQGRSESIRVIDTSQVDDATYPSLAVSKEADTVACRPNTSPLITTESGRVFQLNTDVPSEQRHQKLSTTINSSNTTLSKSIARPADIENQKPEKRARDDLNKPSRSLSTQLSSNNPESVSIISTATASSDPPQIQHNNNDISLLWSSKASKTNSLPLVDHARTSSCGQGNSDRKEEKFISNSSPEIVTSQESTNVELSSQISDHALDLIAPPTILGNHSHDYTDSTSPEDGNSLFSDSQSDTEPRGDVSESYKTSVQESQHSSKILGQWAVVEPDKSKDDVEETSMKDSEDLLRMQMLDIESKKPHTRAISVRDSFKQYASNKRQKLETRAQDPSRSKNETVPDDNSKLIHQQSELEDEKPSISNKERRARVTSPDRKDAKRLASIRHRQKRKQDILQQGPQHSIQSSPEPISLHAVSSEPIKQQTMGKPEARGFAALNSAPIAKRRRINRQNVSSRAKGPRHKNIPLSRRNLRLSMDDRIAAIKNQLSAYEPKDIQGVNVPEDQGIDVEVLPIGLEAPSTAYAFESSSSSDEDETEEQAKQRRLLKRAALATAQKVPCNPVPEPPDNGRPTYARKGVGSVLETQPNGRPTCARKGIGRKTMESEAATSNDTPKVESEIVTVDDSPKIEPEAITIDDSSSDASTEAKSEQHDDATASESDTTEEDMLWRYTVTRHTRSRSPLADDDIPPTDNDVSPPSPLGTFLSLPAANHHATSTLLSLLPSAPPSNAITLSTCPLGLRTCTLTTPSSTTTLTVTRSLAHHAPLPRSAARVPPVVYGVYHRVITRYRNPEVRDTYAYLHLGTYALRDLANREAGRAWLAYELREGKEGEGKGDKEEGLLVERTRNELDGLEAEGGCFRRGERVVKGEGMEMGEAEVETDVWVDERAVWGPRN